MLYGFKNALNLVVGPLWLTNSGMVMCVYTLVYSTFCVLVTRLYHLQQIDQGCMKMSVAVFIYLYYGFPGMTQLTRKSPIALRLILRGLPGPMA